MFTRERHRRGTVYFGPYANAKKVRETLDVLNRVFQFRPCEGPKPGRHSGIPCLDFHIERCTAPVHRGDLEGGLPRADRRRDRLPLGRHAHDRARARARDARGGGRGAVRGRDPLPQPPVCDREPRCSARAPTGARRHDRRDRARVDGDRAAVQLFPLRDGAPDRPLRVPPRERRGSGPRNRPRGFCLEYYGGPPSVPPRADRPRRPDGHRGACAASSPISEASAVEVRGPRVARRSGSRAGRRERGARPRADDDRRGAESGCAGSRRSRAARGAQPREPAVADRMFRHLEPAGSRDRGLDVGLRGRPAEEAPTTARSACAARRARTTSRRSARWSPAASLGCGRPTAPTTSFGRIPNLVVIDGGKGQLAAALDAIASEAGRRGSRSSRSRSARRRCSYPVAPHPILLDPHDAGLQLLQRIRDEAHRFAIRHHRRRRDTAAFASIFDTLDGRRACSAAGDPAHFGSAERFLAASQEELEGVPGLPAKTARAVFAPAAQGRPSLTGAPSSQPQRATTAPSLRVATSSVIPDVLPSANSAVPWPRSGT